ncbi:DinB family protein [Pseudoneobacillus sp. C159]
MNVKDVLLVQLNASQENTWFVSLINSIKGLTEEQASWKPNENANSIFEIVNHLLFYNQRHLNWFKDLPNESVVDKSSFRNHQELSWNDTVKRIKDIEAEWSTVVAEADDKKLEEKAHKIAHHTIHTAYHTGQILYIRKLQGLWNPQDGVEG